MDDRLTQWHLDRGFVRYPDVEMVRRSSRRYPHVIQSAQYQADMMAQCFGKPANFFLHGREDVADYFIAFVDATHVERGKVDYERGDVELPDGMSAMITLPDAGTRVGLKYPSMQERHMLMRKFVPGELPLRIDLVKLMSCMGEEFEKLSARDYDALAIGVEAVFTQPVMSRIISMLSAELA